MKKLWRMIPVWAMAVGLMLTACAKVDTPVPPTTPTTDDPKEPEEMVLDGVVVEHEPTATMTYNNTEYDISAYQSMSLDDILGNFMTDDKQPSKQKFYLRGGKTYHLSSPLSVIKGFTLCTHPQDLAQGKRATVYLSAMIEADGSVPTCNFMLSRTAGEGENPDDPAAMLKIDSLCFKDIDFDAPLARNAGDGNASGNYFINVYSNNVLGFNLEALVIQNCTFQRIIRGFARFQNNAKKVINHFTVEGCLFYNCGYYNSNGRSYNWFNGDPSSNAETNMFVDMVFRNNTIYDSPLGYLFTSNNRNLTFTSGYNITVENNTFVNFNTRANNIYLVSMRYLPGDSKITIKKNLFIQTKQEGDTRDMYFAGADVRNITGSASAVFDIADNYSTNAFLTEGEIFSAASFAATKNSFGSWPAMNIGGAEALKVVADDIAPTELMVNPNPPFTAADAAKMHHVDNLSGLYYQNTEKVRQSAIYKLGIGDPRWRQQ